MNFGHHLSAVELLPTVIAQPSTDEFSQLLEMSMEPPGKLARPQSLARIAWRRLLGGVKARTVCIEMGMTTCSPSHKRSLDEYESTESIDEDVSNDEVLHDANGSNGEETMDDMWLTNPEFSYTEDMLRSAGVVVGPGTGWCTAEAWLAGGGEIRLALYDELEDQWDAAADIVGCTEDRNMGGGLYQKSQQAAMRQRLLFDCVKEVLERQFSWVGMPDVCGGKGQMSVASVWGELRQLERGPCSAEDSMYAMLEQDLLEDADYTSPYCWRGRPTQLASVASTLSRRSLIPLSWRPFPILQPTGDDLLYILF